LNRSQYYSIPALLDMSSAGNFFLNVSQDMFGNKVLTTPARLFVKAKGWGSIKKSLLGIVGIF